jgi:hypothetical protein
MTDSAVHALSAIEWRDVDLRGIVVDRRDLSERRPVRKIVMSGLLALVALAVAVGNAQPTAAATAASSPRGHQGITATAFLIDGKISCGSPTSCLAVGDNLDASTELAPIAEAWNGRAWHRVSIPMPKPTVALIDLADVSCKSAASCLVVGTYLTLAGAGAERPYAMTWNGTSLSPTAAPPVTKDSGFASLTGVSCLTARSCVAVGDSQGGSGPLTLETWNGAKWALRTARIPGHAGPEYPGAVSCLSVTSCVVAGESFSSLSGAPSMLLARWNGKGLTEMKATAPAGAANVILNDVSCASAGSCVAAGFSTNTAGTRGFGFAERWNGASWTAHKAAVPKGNAESFLYGVSCRPGGRCIAVGSAGPASAMKATALSDNGKTWSAQNVPGPGKDKTSDFASVSCPKAGECVALGDIGPAGQATATPLGGLWNGSSWRLVAA